MALVIVAVLVCLYYADRSFQSRAALAKAQAAYDDLAKVTAADHEVQQGIIENAEARIDEQDVTIGHLTNTIAAKQAELDRLAAIVAQPVPPSTPDVEALPTVIALRGQVSTLTLMVTEAGGIIADQERVITSWETKFNAQVEITDATKRQYDNERALRIAAEGMASTYRSALRGAKTWRTVALVAGAAAAASILTK